MKIILLVIVLFFAVAVGMALLVRLTQNQQRLAELHRDLKRNNAELERQRRELERLAAEKEAQKPRDGKF
ncbi:hypothetical protein EON83_10350 [bacterium]|nr:MAG: hypothetical protein EON83_10350 [bacterium]